MFLGIFTLTPSQVHYYKSRRMSRFLQKLGGVGRYDVAHVVLVRMMQYANHLSGMPVVLDQIDALSLNMLRRLDHERNPLVRLALKIEAFKLRHYEARGKRLCDHSVITSPVDAKALNYPLMEVVPNGVDSNFFHPSRLPKEIDAIFTGNMGYFPNVDAALHFKHSIMPHLKQEQPDFKHFVVGADPDPRVKRIHDENNTFVTGYVDDIREYLGRAKVFVAPLRSGTGIQNKILEAMSSGIPVVSSSHGNAGIGAMPDEEIIVADRPDDFATKVLGLLQNTEKRRKLAENGRRLVERNHSWENKTKILERVYRTARVLHKIKTEEHHSRRVPLDMLETMEDAGIMEKWARPAKLASIWLTRSLDLLAAGMGLILASPLLLFASVAIMATDGRPVFFSQTRTGKNGRTFKLHKLRTMRTDAESRGACFASAGDDRITPIGRILRKSRIDEIPQLVNVCKGEMSFIGPRPERPEFIEQFEKQIPLYSTRLLVKPGITGWAQVMAPYAADVKQTREKLTYDLYYLKNRSALMDVGIIFKTAQVVLTGRGAR